MSYGFDMAFCQVTEDKVLETMDGFIKWLNKENVAKEHIANYITFSPAYEIINHPERESRKGVLMDTKHWLRRMFTVEFVYWPQYKLLALAGHWPLSVSEGETLIKNNIFGKSIYFQNSTDKDYELDEWNSLPEMIIRPLLDEPVSQREALEYIEFDMDEYTEEELNSPASDYVYRTYVYQNIFNTLSLDDWLYGDNPEAFKRYKLCAMLTDYAENNFARMALSIAKKRHSEIHETL